MAANVNAIYSRLGDIQWIPSALLTANTAKDGTGTVLTVFTADALEGGFLTKLVVAARGTNVATVLRVFINNGLTNATAANNTLYTSHSIAATTLSEVAALAITEILMGIAVPAGYKINLTIGTTVAAGLSVTTIGGKY